jgi:hypothetical protein
MENKYKNSKKKNSFADKNASKQTRSRVLSLAQLLSRVRKQRGFSGLTQGHSNIQSGSMSSTQTRNSQFGTNQKGVGSYSFGNYTSEGKGKGRSFGEQGLNPQRDKMFSSASSGGMTKAQIRMESQKEEQKRQKPIKPIIPPKSLV